MTDPITIAAQAVAILTPYLSDGGKEVAKIAAKDLYGWLKGTLTGPTAVALDDLEKKPTDGDNQAYLRKSLVKAIEADPSFGTELNSRLSVATAAGATAQTLDQSGSTNARATQVHGDNNIVSNR